MALAPFASVDLSALRWRRASGSLRDFELLSGDVDIARLSWPDPHASSASAEGAEGKWTLERRGFLIPQVSVHQVGDPKELARTGTRFSLHRIEHPIRFDTGVEYALHHESAAISAWKLFDSNGVESINVEPVRDGRHLEGGLCVVSEAGRRSAELALLLLLSWYFVVSTWFEDEAVAEWTDHLQGRF